MPTIFRGILSAYADYIAVYTIFSEEFYAIGDNNS